MATKPDSKRKPPRRRRPAAPSGRRKPATDLLHSIATSLSALYGERYLHALTRYLTDTLGIEYAFIGELARDRKKMVNVVSACLEGKTQDNFSYSLINTPCQHIIRHGGSTYPRQVQKLFPKDRYLAEIGAECYVGIPLFGSSGQPLGLISVIGRQSLRDRETVESVLEVVASRTATELERQRLYQELGESYRTLATLMANLPGLVYRCRNDKDWSMEFISEGCLPLTGYVPDDFVKRRTISYGELIHPDDRDPVWSEVQAALKQNRPFQLVYRITTADGNLKWVWEQGRGVFTSQGELLALEGFITDITERRRAEEALRESETWLHSMVNTALNIIIVLSPDHRILEFNPEAERVYGRRREEVLGKDYFELFLPREMWRLVDDDLQGVLAGKETRGFENSIHSADGSKRLMVWNVSRMDDANGQPIGVVAVGSDVTEHKRDEEIAARFGRVIDSSSNEVYVFDAGTLKFVQVNEGARRNLGYSTEELAELTPLDIKPKHTRKTFETLIAPLKRREVEALTFETIHRRKDGSLYPVEVRLQLSHAENPPVFVAVILDITDRLKAQAQMQKLSRALEQTADAVMITDRDGAIEYVNPAFEQVSGYTSAEAVGRQPNLLKSGRQGPGFYENLWKTILAGEVFNDVIINRRKDGSLYYEEKTITPVKDASGHITHFVSTGKDITERMQTQERLAFMAQHDPLTELPNRALLLDRLKQSLAGARWRERRAGILFVDLDRFKTINDTLGHEVGDRLLQQLAERFQRSVRDGDTVARFGGDEFVILLDDVATEDDVAGVAQKVLQALAPPFHVDHQTLYVTASIGVSLFPNDGEDASTLLRNADIAMYRAKEMGKNTYQFYSADMSSRAFERLTLESNLRRALEQGEFRLYYQPQVDVTTGAIVGVEALLRWQHPEFGLVMPNDFIPLLEETGLIVPTGAWVLDAACAQLAAWHAQGWPRLRLAVNLSPRQFQTPNLTTVVKQAVDRLDGDPGRVELEITEGMLLRHVPITAETLEALHSLGVRMAIDDFGTGYSSLSYLRRLPIDTLKIDRMFVRDIPHDPDDSAITVAIIALVQSMKLEMIAEGVENTAQRDFLQARGCNVMQGFLFSRPLPAEEITRLLQSGKKFG